MGAEGDESAAGYGKGSLREEAPGDGAAGGAGMGKSDFRHGLLLSNLPELCPREPELPNSKIFRPLGRVFLPKKPSVFLRAGEYAGRRPGR